MFQYQRNTPLKNNQIYANQGMINSILDGSRT